MTSEDNKEDSFDIMTSYLKCHFNEKCIYLLGILFTERTKDKKSQSSRDCWAECYATAHSSATAANVTTRDN